MWKAVASALLAIAAAANLGWARGETPAAAVAELSIPGAAGVAMPAGYPGADGMERIAPSSTAVFAAPYDSSAEALAAWAQDDGGENTVKFSFAKKKRRRGR